MSWEDAYLEPVIISCFLVISSRLCVALVAMETENRGALDHFPLNSAPISAHFDNVQYTAGSKFRPMLRFTMTSSLYLVRISFSSAICVDFLNCY